MPINPKYKFLSETGPGGNAFGAGMALWGGPSEAPQRATPYIPGGLTPDIMQAVQAARKQPAQPQPAPQVNRPATQPVAPVAPMQPMAQPEQFQAPEFGIPPEPPGLIEPASQMREEDLPPEPPQPAQPSAPEIPENFDRTTISQKAQAMGMDPRQLFVALAELSAGLGNIKGQPQQSTARGFYEMQKKYENQDRDSAMRAMRLEQPAQIKTVDPLTEQYKQTQIDYLKSKMQPKTVAQPDPLKQQLLQEQIKLTQARRKEMEAGWGSNANLPEAAGGEPKMSQKAVKMASELRKEYQNNAVTKTTRDVKTQWNKVKDVLENPSAAGDMAAIFMFMKTLDPGSTVREGEYKSAAEATSAAGRVQTYAQNVSNGSKLNPEQRLDFKRTIEKFYRAQMKEQERVNREYRALAERSGIDARDLLIESDDATPAQKLRSVHDLPDAR